MRIIITGAGGFLGAHVVSSLTTSGVDVIAVTSKKDSIWEKSVEVLKLDDFLKGRCDVCQDDAVINCLFPTNADGLELAAGLDLLAAVMQAANRAGVKSFLNISSQSVYKPERERPASEDDDVCLSSLYAVGKYSSELICRSVFQSSDYCNVRLASLIGVGYELRIVNRLIDRALDEGKLVVIGGEQRYGLLDVRDAASGLAKMALSDCRKWRDVYNLGPDGSCTLVQVASLIAELVESMCGIAVEVVTEKGNDRRNSAIDPSRFIKDFEWRPSISLRQSVADIVAAKARVERVVSA